MNKIRQQTIRNMYRAPKLKQLKKKKKKKVRRYLISLCRSKCEHVFITKGCTTNSQNAKSQLVHS